jgi:hypothetical protein
MRADLPGLRMSLGSVLVVVKMSGGAWIDEELMWSRI